MLKQLARPTFKGRTGPLTKCSDNSSNSNFKRSKQGLLVDAIGGDGLAGRVAGRAAECGRSHHIHVRVNGTLDLAINSLEAAAVHCLLDKPDGTTAIEFHAATGSMRLAAQVLVLKRRGIWISCKRENARALYMLVCNVEVLP